MTSFDLLCLLIYLNQNEESAPLCHHSLVKVDVRRGLRLEPDRLPALSQPAESAATLCSHFKFRLLHHCSFCSLPEAFLAVIVGRVLDREVLLETVAGVGRVAIIGGIVGRVVFGISGSGFDLPFKEVWSLLVSWRLVGVVIVGFKVVVGAGRHSACSCKTNAINFALDICNEELILPLLVSESLQLVLEFFQQVGGVHIIVLLEQFVLLLQSFEHTIVLFHFGGELLVHLDDDVVLLQQFLLQTGDLLIALLHRP